MKRDVVFVLEQAAWPAFLVESAGVIRRLNSAALNVFGLNLQGAAAQLSSIWAPDNEGSANEFLAKVQNSTSGAAPVKFLLKENSKESFLTYVTPVSRDGQTYYVFQLFHENGNHAAALPAFREVVAAAPPPKPELLFALENSAWPALVITRDGAIQRANEAAVAAFGSHLRSGGVKLASFWLPQNGPIEKFLSRSGESEPSKQAAFRLKDGAVQEFEARLAPVRFEEQDCILLQFFKRVEPPKEAAPKLEATAPQPLGIAPKLEAPKLEPLSAVPAASPEAAVSSMDSGTAHKQKLDCALQLARSVALDFNNALTSILGHTSLLLGQSEANHPWRNSLVEIEKSASKAAEIANDLAAFSRQEKDARVQSSGNLNSVLQRAVDAFRGPEVPETNWALQFERRLFAVTFDEAKMQQAFVKVLENSMQALTADGRISVQTRNLELSEVTQDRTAKLAPGNYVCVEIADNGSGIAADVLPRIFEPFFTTKKTGNHRGLGLAWVYGIVTNHGGSVAVSSQPEAGTSVRVYLPAQKKIVKDSAVSTGDLSGTEIILLVDDEDLLLTMGQMILSSFGYKVLTANSGQKALEIFKEQKDQINLVITDLVMPNMSGRELMEHIRRIAPETKIICSSGYVRSGNVDEDEVYLQKPFTSQDLLRKVKQTLSPEPG